MVKQLLDACVNNCNKPFHLELASRDFEQELYRLVKKLHPRVSAQLKQCIKKWAEGDFKTDSQLSLIPALYIRLKQEGVDFSGNQEPVSVHLRFPNLKRFLNFRVEGEENDPAEEGR